MGKKSSDPPDVVGAAREEGAISAEQQQRQLYADRPDQFNLLGGLQWTPTYSTDPVTGKKVTRWTQEQNLSPLAGASVNPLFDNFADRAEMVKGMNGRIADEMGGAPDWGQFGDYQDLNFDPTELRSRAEDAIYQKETRRLDSRFSRESEALDIQLRNQGLRPGDQAYDAQMSSFGNTKNDAYEGARLNAVTGGQSEAAQLFQQQQDAANFANSLRDKDISEYIGKRGFSLGEADSLTPINDLTSLAGLITGQGLGGNAPEGS